MPERTVRISPTAHQALSALSVRLGMSMTALLDRAVEKLRREEFVSELNAAFAALKSDRRKWREELDERQDWDRVTHVADE